MIFSVANCCIFRAMTSTWHKAKQFLAPSIKILVLIACFSILYFQWQERPIGLDAMLYSLKSISFFTIGLMLFLSLASWLVESKKWQLLVKDVEELSFRESVLQSLTAQAASFITPLRAGEFAFKALFFEKRQRQLIMSRVFLGNYSQMAVTVALGVLGLIFFLGKDLLSAVYLIIILICSVLFLIFTYLKLQQWWKLKTISKSLWFQVMSLSFLRYLLFASNWLVMLYFLKSNINILSWLDNIAVNYFAVSVIPMFQIFDIPVKWAAASFTFNGTLSQPDFIILATTMIWITNTLFPTALGCVLLPFKKFKTL